MSFEHPVSQGSEAWANLRLGHPTASDFDQLVTPEFKVRTGQMPQTYLYAKLAEHILGRPLEQGTSFQMDQGNLAEPEARAFLELMMDVKVRQIGLVSTDDMKVACSPDGLIDPDGGLELKCPRADTHLRYLLEGVLPPQYAAQVHGSMYVTGRKWWVFMSYARGLPPFILRVERDEAIQAALRTALDAFLARFAAALGRIEGMGKG